MKTRLPIIILAALLLALFPNYVHAQSSASDYEKHWQEVRSLEKQGLPRSALEVVESIYTLAVDNNDGLQMVKSLEYSIRLSSSFEEDYIKKGVARINSEMPKFKAPARQVMHALVAELYLAHYASNRHIILDRTNIVDIKPEDMASWDQLHFAEAIFSALAKSLEDANSLKKVPAAAYAEILKGYDSLNIYRPTLYDILAHNALDFYRNEEFMASRPADHFEIDDPQMIDIAEVFVKLDMKEKDEFSMQYHALHLFRDLIAFHIDDKDPTVLVNIDLQRLEFVRMHATFEGPDLALRYTLEQMENMYIGNETVAEIYYQLASGYNASSSLYQPLESDEHKRDLLIAAQYCRNATEEFPGSYGARLCQNLLKQIEAKSLNTTVEYGNLPAKSILASLAFRNVKTVFVRIVALDPTEEQKWNRSRDEHYKIEQYRKLRPEKHWAVELPIEIDHNGHITEFAIPPLTEGYYGLMVSDNPAFDNTKGVVNINSFWVSGISYISNKEGNGDYRFYVLDRLTGHPLPHVDIKVYAEVYNQQIREFDMVKRFDLKSDDSGAFLLPAGEGQNGRLLLEFINGPDRFISPNYFYSSRINKPDARPVNITYFFTDRSIYRPGQTIYFKGILVERIAENYELRKNTATTVNFYDANRQLISSLPLESNEYGSIHGSFIAPSGLLTGTMRIQNETGSTGISVEEYKRPRFELVFDPVKGSYKLGTEVRVTGKAVAYSGQAIDQAAVKYRIVRNAFRPYPYFRGDYPFYSETAEIGSGTTITDAEGKFSIDFKAIPDKNARQMFSFTVYVDVTDPGGETHSEEKNVFVGDKSLLIKLEIPELVNGRDNPVFPLETTNLNGEAEPATINVKITKLQGPGKVYKDRKWSQKPDVYLLGEEKFRELFPGFAYRDENERMHWKDSEVLISKVVDSRSEKELRLEGLSGWGPGEYRIDMKAKDIFGEDVTVTRYFTLYNPASNALPRHERNWFVPMVSKAEPGDMASLLIGSSYNSVKVLFELQGKAGILKHEWITLDNEQKILEIPVREEDRGGLGVSLVFIHDNESFENSYRIDVPYSNKQLDISFASFRDKLLPGQKETWNIMIRSHEGNKVAAEMLAGMYDASLDDFKPHRWNFDLFTFRLPVNKWENSDAFGTAQGRLFQKYDPFLSVPAREYAELDWKNIYFRGFISPYYYKNQQFDGVRLAMDGETGLQGSRMEEEIAAEDAEQQNIVQQELPVSLPEAAKPSFSLRRNLQETAFFFPELRTNEAGDVIISFTMPESLTRWKMMGLAHTQDLSTAVISKELITQKDLMVVPNAPRFFRVGDEILFSARVVNLSNKELRGKARLILLDAITMKILDEEFANENAEIGFTASKGNSALVSWSLKVPEINGPVLYRVMAEAGNFSDGEETMVPVLQNRMLVTESLPLPVKGQERRDFVFEKLANMPVEGGTIRQHAYTIEFTSNPAWYAVQALPYMMDSQNECAEQVFSRAYANGLASHIMDRQPKIKNVFESWKSDNPDALLSKLENNQDLKNALLEETPWVMQARDESERKNRIALLFDLNRMEHELATSLNTLSQMQLLNGGWPWFQGGPDNRYITQYILTGFGRMLHVNALDNENAVLSGMIRNALAYADARMFEEFSRIKEEHNDYRNDNHLSQAMLQYLYMRTLFTGTYFLLEKHQEGFLYIKEQAKKYWTDYDKYLQGMIALSLHRLGDKPQPAMIMASIREHALYDDEMGMYWRRDPGFFWYEAPIETQALLIEAFDEILSDEASVELMKTWLLKQKQTNDWKTSRATADACYALLLRGDDLLSQEGKVIIRVGGEVVDAGASDGNASEAGTGYFRHQWDASEIKPELANISISKADKGIAWGAVYWQYFEDLDKITGHSSPLSITKRLFLEVNTSSGPKLEPVEEGDVLHTGDKLVSRIEIISDRDMEFVHMKDMRAAALEPLASASGYRWQGGLGYYESIRDASVNFFFSYLPKGTWVFEYPFHVTQRGSFSNGISTIQCMYAPEFASHTEGVRIEVE